MGFNYDHPGGAAYTLPPGYVQEEDDLYNPSVDLAIPEGMEIPRTNKENAIIEKTAKFIAEHGAQMEIMIKAKQKDNPQFEFMDHDHPLSLYFKHVVKMIKSGKYHPMVAPKPTPPEKQDSSMEGEDEEDHHGYLHPSLMSSVTAAASSKVVPKPVVRVDETPYGDLIKSVTKSMRNDMQQNSDASQGNAPPLAPPPLPPFMAQDMYGPSQKKLPPPPGLEPVTLPHPDYQTSPDQLEHQSHARSEKNGSKKQIPREVSNMGPQIVPPAPDIQPIIDRMALYVAKNGVDFETVVKSKSDPRFDFLHPGHMHYAYYDFRKRLHLEEIEQEKSEDDDRQNSSKGVSFKLKTKEQENTQLDKRKAFDYESTDDEDGEDGKAREYQPSPSEPRDPVPLPAEKPNQLSAEELERKQAEDKLKDRLALAAREKLAQASKEKQIQAERKRKAAMFITLLKTGSQAAGGADDKVDAGTGEASAGSGPNSLHSSRPGTPYDLLSGKNSPASDRPASPSTASHSTSEDQLGKSKTTLPRAYYGIPASIRRFPRSPTPPTSYSRSWRSRSRSRSPRRFSRVASPPSKRWSDRPRSRSPRRFDRSSTSRRKSPSPLKPTSRRSKSPSFDRRKARSKRSRSRTPKRSKRSPSHSKSKKKKHKKSRSRSRSPSKKSKESSRREAKRIEPVTVVDLTTCDVKGNNGVKYADSVQTSTSSDKLRSSDTASDTKGLKSPTEGGTVPPLPKLPQVSDEKISKVKAMLKASRKAILKEEGVDIDL